MSPRMSEVDLATRQYAVFISYRHADNLEMGRKWANWLHEALESYEVPPDLIGKTSLRGDKVPASLYPVFRDEEELPADADLSTNIRRALENSGLLVVLCSPRAVQSRFVADEIRFFKEQGKSDRMLALMIDGEPNASDDPAKVALFGAAAECFPEPLRFGVADPEDPRRIDWKARTEPIAADVRPGGHCVQGWTTAAAYREQLVKEGKMTARQIGNAVNEYHERLELAKLKIIAGALGLPLGELTQRDKAFQLAKAKRRQKLIATAAVVFGVLAVAAIVGAFVAWQQQQMAQKQTLRAVGAEAKTAEQLKETHRQLELSQLQEGRAWLERARVAKASGDTLSALLLAGRSVGYEGHGRKAGDDYPLLLANPLKEDLSAESIRQSEMKKAEEFIHSVTPTLMPLWSSPIVAAHGGADLAPIWSRDGQRIIGKAGEVVRIWDARSGALLHTCTGHTQEVTSIGMSPDGTRLASGSKDGTVRLWDASSGSQLAVYSASDSPITSVTFCLEGGSIAAGSADKAIHVWDIGTRRMTGSFSAQDGWINVLAAYNQGSVLVVGTSAGKLERWDLAKQERLQTLSDSRDPIFHISISPDDRCMASLAGSYSITERDRDFLTLWDLKMDTPLPAEPKQRELTGITFSSDSQTLALCSRSQADFWDVKAGKDAGPSAPADKQSYLDSALSPDGRTLAALEYLCQTIILWDVATRTRISRPTTDHYQPVTRVMFSPDGTRLASRAWDDKLKIWDVATGSELMSLDAAHSLSGSMAYGPDGSWIVCAGEEGQYEVWDLQKRSKQAFGQKMELGLRNVAFNTDGRYIIAVDEDKSQLLFLDPASGKTIASLSEPEVTGEGLAICSDGYRVAAATGENDITIWNLAERKPIVKMTGHTGHIVDLRFDASGARLVSGSYDKSARVWDTTNGQLLMTFVGHSERVSSVDISSDGKSIATGAADKTARVWDVETGKVLTVYSGHGEEVRGVDISPDDKRLAIACGDGVVAVCDMARSYEVGRLTGVYNSVQSIAWSPDGRFIATAGGGIETKVWDVVTGRQLASLNTPLRTTSLAFSGDSRHLVTGDEDAKVRLWNLADPEKAQILEGHGGKIAAVCYSPDGKRIASCAGDWLIKQWDAATGKQLLSIKTGESGVNAVAFSPDGAALASATYDGKVKLWDSGSGKEIKSFAGHTENVMSLAFSPDGRFIATGATGKPFKIWNVASGQLQASCRDLGWVSDGVFRPGSQTLATMEENLIRFWDPETGDLQARMEAPLADYKGLAFSPDGMVLATSNSDHGVSLWDIHKHIAGKAHDLLAPQRSGYLQLVDDQVRWTYNDRLFKSRVFEPIHPCADMISRMAEKNLPPAQQFLLRLQQCSKARQWRSCHALWREITAAGLSTNAELRTEYVVHLAVTARELLDVVPTTTLPQAPEEIWKTLLAELKPEHFNELRLTLPLAQAVQMLMNHANYHPDMSSAVAAGLPKLASARFLDESVRLVLSDLEYEKKPTPAKKAQSLYVRAVADTHATTAAFQRSALKSCAADEPDRLKFVTRLLDLPDATIEDFHTNIYAMAPVAAFLVQTKELMEKMLAKFPKEESVQRMAGWCYININESAAALRCFDTTQSLQAKGGKSDTDLLAGMAIARWLNHEEEAAIATCRQLIEAGRSQDKPTDWTDPKTYQNWTATEVKAMDEVRAATLAKHPELTPAKKPE